MEAIQVIYDVTEVAIAEKREHYAGLTATTSDGYESVRLAIADCRETRVAVEARRKELKKESLEYGRRVDDVARHLTQQLEAIEQPLKDMKAQVDKEKERAKASAEEAKLREWQAQLQAERAAEDERQRAEREAAAERLRRAEAALAAERASLAAERADAEQRQREAEALRIAEAEKLAAQQRLEADRNRIEREALVAERAQIEAQRVAAERAESARLAGIAAKERAERGRVAAEAARAAELQRIAEMRPDIEKLQDYSHKLLALSGEAPLLATAEAKVIRDGVVNSLCELAHSLCIFTADHDDNIDI